MTYRGTILNGVVVFDGAQHPPDGTSVEVRPVETPANGERTSALDDIARRQGVTGPASFDELLGGWPEGEEGNGFEDAVARWRSEEPQ
jgi:hypothetical protein